MKHAHANLKARAGAGLNRIKAGFHELDLLKIDIEVSRRAITHEPANCNDSDGPAPEVSNRFLHCWISTR